MFPITRLRLCALILFAGLAACPARAAVRPDDYPRTAEPGDQSRQELAGLMPTFVERYAADGYPKVVIVIASDGSCPWEAASLEAELSACLRHNNFRSVKGKDLAELGADAAARLARWGKDPAQANDTARFVAQNAKADHIILGRLWTEHGHLVGDIHWKDCRIDCAVVAESGLRDPMPMRQADQARINQHARDIAIRLLKQYCQAPSVLPLDIDLYGLPDTDAQTEAIQALRSIAGVQQLRTQQVDEGGRSKLRASFITKGVQGSDIVTIWRKELQSRLDMPVEITRQNQAGAELLTGDEVTVPMWAILTALDGSRLAKQYAAFRQSLPTLADRANKPKVAILMDPIDAGGAAVWMGPAQPVCGGGFTTHELAGALGNVFRDANFDVVESKAAQRNLNAAALQQARHVGVNDLLNTMAEQCLYDWAVMGKTEANGHLRLDFVDLRNARHLGAETWNGKAKLATARFPVKPDEVDGVANYLAGNLLYRLVRQGGTPHIMDVVVKDAQSIDQVFTAAETMRTTIANVVSVDGFTYDHGLGAFTLRYKLSSMDQIHKALLANRALPFEVEQANNGALHLRLKQAPRPNGAAAAVAAPRPAAANSRSWALVIGVYRNDPRIAAQLEDCQRDAILMGRTLRETCGYDPGRVIVLADGLGDGALDPTAANIMTAVSTIAAKAGPDENVLVYFSGHGMRVPIRDAQGKVLREDCFLLPMDRAAEGGPKMVSVTALRDVLSQSKAAMRVVFLDSCHAGVSAAPAGLEGRLDFLHALPPAQGIATIASCLAVETSLSSPRYKQGLFTYWLARGMQGEADLNKDGKVELSELYKFVHEQVAKDARDNHNGHSQHPFLFAAIQGEVVISQFAKP